MFALTVFCLVLSIDKDLSVRVTPRQPKKCLQFTQIFTASTKTVGGTRGCLHSELIML